MASEKPRLRLLASATPVELKEVSVGARVSAGRVGSTVDELLPNNCAAVSAPSLPMLLPWLPLKPTLTEAPALSAAAQPAPLSV